MKSSRMTKEEVAEAQDFIAEVSSRKTYRTRILEIPGDGVFRAPKKTGPNDPCECGSGRKHKHCRFKGLCKGEL